jgi:hypothetical protein
MHVNDEDSSCKHGSLDASSLSYGPFYFGRRRIKNKVNSSVGKCLFTN